MKVLFNLISNNIQTYLKISLKQLFYRFLKQYKSSNYLLIKKYLNYKSNLYLSILLSTDYLFFYSMIIYKYINSMLFTSGKVLVINR